MVKSRYSHSRPCDIVIFCPFKHSRSNRLECQPVSEMSSMLNHDYGQIRGRIEVPCDLEPCMEWGSDTVLIYDVVTLHVQYPGVLHIGSILLLFFTLLNTSIYVCMHTYIQSTDFQSLQYQDYSSNHRVKNHVRACEHTINPLQTAFIVLTSDFQVTLRRQIIPVHCGCVYFQYFLTLYALYMVYSTWYLQIIRLILQALKTEFWLALLAVYQASTK